VHLVDVSSGGAVSHQQIPLEPNYQVFARKHKKTGILTGESGSTIDASQAEEIITSEKVDLVLSWKRITEIRI
jgi:2,4-dienoyl-CoA reductase-like NADH-dependent reductase (Old Yellow Enzyme family)